MVVELYEHPTTGLNTALTATNSQLRGRPESTANMLR